MAETSKGMAKFRAPYYNKRLKMDRSVFRIKQENGIFFPEVWSNEYLKCFSGFARVKNSDGDKDVSFPTSEEAQEWLKETFEKN